MVTDEEAERMKRDMADGVRGPVMLKYVRLLLSDRDERIRAARAAREAEAAVPRRRSGPRSGRS